ncbi:hypothetical protein EYF80_039870 [Liparis tanakae]|uniref:Uncharacterized protein n=1 Tax=Liparis tanakae TaxID=230148 RepID=A0A4Z2GAG1_9TELE|nr:hypothetical protein EYF80_039870 [Liparis tanakae]
MCFCSRSVYPAIFSFSKLSPREERTPRSPWAAMALALLLACLAEPAATPPCSRPAAGFRTQSESVEREGDAAPLWD